MRQSVVRRSYDDFNEWLALRAKSSAAPSGSGEVQEIRFAIGTGAEQTSAHAIPAGAIVTDCELNITTDYSGGTTITVGSTVTANLLMATGDSVPTSLGLYAVHQDTPWPVASVVAVAVAGGPVAGVGVCIVRFVQTPMN